MDNGSEKDLSQEHQDQRYSGNGQHRWEGVVRSNEGHGIERLRVLGGYLYRDAKTGSLVFVPMPEVVKYKV